VVLALGRDIAIVGREQGLEVGGDLGVRWDRAPLVELVSDRADLVIAAEARVGAQVEVAVEEDVPIAVELRRRS
jgi:hypothetical protein